MEAVFRSDNSFFKFSLLAGVDITSDVINLSISEENGGIINGSLTLFDPLLQYHNILKLSTSFSISFGYKTNSVKEVYLNSKNPNEIYGIKSRDNINCIVISGNGNAQNNGNVTFTCGFIGNTYMTDSRKVVKYTSGNKLQVVQTVMARLGITKTFIDFDRQSETVGGTDLTIAQWTSDFRFLNDMASEWQSIFSVGLDPAGLQVGLFLGKNKIKDLQAQNFIKSCLGAVVGNNKLFEYGIGSTKANVISYTWKNNAGENGTGDGTVFHSVNGVPQTMRYFVEGGTVKAYKLNTENVKKFMNEYKGGNAKLEATGLILQAQEYNSKVADRHAYDFFDVVDQSTAPQGEGYTINIEALGDPTVMPPGMVIFGNGFPDFWHYNNAPVKDFFIKKVDHKFDQSGYKMSLEIADIVTVYGSFVM
jgi:hypothetical protein